MLDCLRSRCVVPRAFRLRIHPRSKRQCAQSALRARTACRYGSGRGTPVASHACVETASIAFSRSPTLADFETIDCIDQPAAPFVQTRALVGLGPQCSVGTWRAAVKMQRARCDLCREASCAEAYTWAASAGTRCGLGCKCSYLRPRFNPMVYHSLWTRGGEEEDGGPSGCRCHAKLVAAGRIKAAGGPASSQARSRKSPQHLCGAMRAAVQPGAAAERQQPPSAPVAAR